MRTSTSAEQDSDTSNVESAIVNDTSIFLDKMYQNQEIRNMNSAVVYLL